MSFINTNSGEIKIIQQVNVDLQDKSRKQDSAPEAGQTPCSRLRLTHKRGIKIDFIRIINAMYECGMFADDKGGRITKQECFGSFGTLLDIDLTAYDKDLSNSMASSVAADKQTLIFDRLKDKHMEIYNSK